jgi:hypothetical protein
MEKTQRTLERRCPRLGGPVPFRYCMIGGDDRQPCHHIFDCWWETFDIVQYLKDNLPADQFNRLMEARPRPKIVSLVELIEKAKKQENE